METWIAVTQKLPLEGQRVLARYEGVYDSRPVTFWRDASNAHFGLPNEADGKGSQPATHWRKIEEIGQRVVIGYQYPMVMGNPITREEIIEGLRDAYRGMLQNERRKDRSLRGFPDMEMILDHIEQHGLPAKSSL